jgi:hypothetical protein
MSKAKAKVLSAKEKREILTVLLKRAGKDIEVADLDSDQLEDAWDAVIEAVGDSSDDRLEGEKEYTAEVKIVQTVIVKVKARDARDAREKVTDVRPIVDKVVLESKMHDAEILEDYEESFDVESVEED